MLFVYWQDGGVKGDVRKPEEVVFELRLGRMVVQLHRGTYNREKPVQRNLVCETEMQSCLWLEFSV